MSSIAHVEKDMTHKIMYSKFSFCFVLAFFILGKVKTNYNLLKAIEDYCD